jgi:mycothiol system anti-sigma-R factor
MSCGKPHETDCSEVLQKVYLYLDSEASEHDCGAIKAHLDECGPCLRQYGLEQHINAMVARACGDETAPESLKVAVLARIQQVRIEITQTIDIYTE